MADILEPLHLGQIRRWVDNGDGTWSPEVAGTVTSTGGTVAQGSTTSGQTGVLTQGAVTTAAPAYDTGETSPLSLTTAGDLRVAPTNNSAVANATNSTGTGITAAGLIAQFDDTAPTTVSENQFGNVRITSQGVLYAAAAATASGGAGMTSTATTVAASSLVLKSGSGNLYDVDITTGGSAGYLMVFAATSAPVDGTVTPLRAYVVAANSSFNKSFHPPLRVSTGTTLVFSTTGPFTKTASATAFMAGTCL